MRYIISKFISAFLCVAVLFCTAPLCFAEPVDFALTPPEDLVIIAGRPVGYTAVYVGTFITDTASKLDESGYDTVIQYDWSIDGDNSWHYTSAWDDYSLSPMFDKIGHEKVFISEAFWLLYDEFYASFSSISDTEEGEDGSELRFIDFDKHSIHMRARYIADKNGEMIFSPWSEPQKVTAEENADKLLTEVNPPVLSDLSVNGNEVSFSVTSDGTFKKAELLLRLLGGSGYVFECEISSSAANITATLPYKEGLNTVNLDTVTLSNEGIISLSAKIYHEDAPTGITALDTIPSPSKISVGSIPAVSSEEEAPSQPVSSEIQENSLSNTQIGGIVLAVVALCIILAAVISSVGKKHRKRSPW